jgi:probable O-glycosylation ligase (exosortase A-associated)
MRDIALTALIFGALPFILKRPLYGALIYAWLSLMAPHHFAFGFATSFPFAAIVAATTIIGLFVTKDDIGYQSTATLKLMILLPLWMTFTWFFALEPDEGSYRVPEILKIFAMIHVTAMVLLKRSHIEWLLWVIVISVGFFGVKGGIYTVLGGGGKVWGPPGNTYLTDNNAIAAALIMVIPLIFYLQSVTTRKWIRYALLASVPACAMAVLGSYSRGSLLGIAAMLSFLWLKSQRKAMFALLLIPLIPVAIGFMPERWTTRMNTIQTYEQDASAMGRINAWHAAFHVANDRPIVGGGYEYYTLKQFAKYAPNPTDVHSAHSIYFQMLGEHGYVGLIIFLSVGASAWFTARRIIAVSKGRADLHWASTLARAIQVSMFGYAVNGAFINIGYWDLIYYEVLILVAVHRLITIPAATPPDPQAKAA